MKKSRKILSKIQVCFVSILFLISAAGCNSEGKVSVMPTMKVVTDFTPKDQNVVVAKTQTLDQYLNVNALVSYEQKEELSFKINNCNFKAIYVNRDEHVEEGQLLAELDSTDLEYQIATRQIDLKRVKLMYDKTKEESGISSLEQNTQLENLKLDMESIELDITHLRKQVNKTQLIAPFSGIVSDIMKIKPGTMVQSNEKVMTIGKPGSLKLESDIVYSYEKSYAKPASNTNLAGIVTGMKVSLIYGRKEPYTEIPATITGITNVDPGVESSPYRDLSAQPFKVTVKPDGLNADMLEVDRKVTLRIKTESLENVVVLPNEAIRGYDDEHLVKVVKGDKIITRRVTTGFVNKEEDIVEITSGLLPGESVLLNN